MSKPSAKSSRPSVIGRYEIVKRIGAGGMGTVYQAIHMDLGRRVALKVLPAEMAAQQEMLDRFADEARHAAKLRHENIVTLYEFGEANSTYFLAMEYVDGCNLHEYIDKKGKLEPDEARKFAIQGAKALAVAHGHNIVHRDIKPSNFLLTQKDGHPLIKLTDFGLARNIDDREFKITKTGTTVGTVDYISPEQARSSRSADIRSDIYSLGCTLYHMLAGRAPFSEGDMTERLLKHVEAKPEDVRKYNPLVPPGLVYVLDKMLEKRPEDRYQTPDELIAELENLPSGPPLSAREALEAIAVASGEKVRASRKASPTAETRKGMAAGTQPIPAASDIKLHYRNSKKKDKKPISSSDSGFVMPFVVEGWGLRLVVLGILAVVCFIGFAITFKGDNKKLKKDDVASEAEGESKQAANASKEDIDKGSKKIVENLKSSLKERREGSDVGADREALNQLSKDGNMDPIQMPGQNLLEDLRNEFKGNGTGSAKRNFAMVQQAYKNLAQGNIPSGDEPAGGGANPPANIPGNTGPVGGESSGGRPAEGSGRGSMPALPPNIQGLLGTQQGQEAGPTNQGKPLTAGGGFPSIDQGPSGNSKSASSNPTSPANSQPNTGVPQSKGGQAVASGSQRTNSPEGASAQRSGAPGSGPGGANVGIAPGTQASTGNQPSGTPPAPKTNRGSSKLDPFPGAIIQNQGPINNAAGQGLDAGPATTVAAPYFVSRSTGPVVDRLFDSVGSAIKTALAKETAETIVIEIRDNGPLFEKPMVVMGRNIVLRAGRGFRPLVVWDPQALAVDNASYLFTVVRGNLALVDVDLAARCNEGSSMAGLLCVESGDLLLVRSSLSVSGRSVSGMSAVQLDGVKSDGTVCRCQLDRCVLRGGEMTALDIRAPMADVLAEDSLLVSSGKPLIHVLGKSGNTPTSLRFRGCTLAAGQSLLRVTPASLVHTQPAVYWLSWDSLLARHGQSSGGELVDLLDTGKVDSFRWKAVNCLYTGWQTLLHYAGGNVAYDNEVLWRAMMHQPQGDRISPQTWPNLALAEPADAPMSFFQVSGAMRFGSTYARGALGCDLSRLPAPRDKWQTWALETVSVGELELPRADAAPAIPAATDGKEGGKRLELTGDFDLGSYLQKQFDEGKLAANAVYHLQGKGKLRTSPVRLKNVHLTLYAEPGERLTLVPRDGVDKDALFDLEGGSLTLLNVAIQFANAKDTPQPSYAVKVQGGHLRLAGCRLQGPMDAVGQSYRGLIRFDGAGESKPEGLPECVISDSILVSGKACVQGQIAGSRLRLHNNVILSLQDALIFEPGAPVGRLNCLALLDNNTFAAQRAVVQMGDAPTLTSSVQPMVLQAQANVFLDPFEDPLHQAGILLFDEQSLSHGLLAWQGKGNAYDKRIDYYVRCGATTAAGWKQTHAAGMRLLGVNRDERPHSIELAPTKGFALDRPPLERLALPPALVQQMKLSTSIGADLAALGLAPKK